MGAALGALPFHGGRAVCVLFSALAIGELQLGPEERCPRGGGGARRSGR